ncbi:MAG: hypothetical protein LLG20_27490 [Acidobacteriales bacterium]|nr:hypothetical protein [Terriglobales bacterium]
MIAVLALGQRTQDHIALCGVFSHTNWKLYEADTRRKGLELVRQKGIRVVICETELPDGNWQVVLDELRDLSVHPQLVVSSHRVDPQLWGEVLNLGAYDLLPTPFEPAEVRRVVVQAWLASKNKVQTETGFRMLSGQVRVAAAQA